MNTLSWIVDGSFSTRLTVALLHFLWQGCAGGILVISGGWLLRAAAARTRYSLNVAAMLLMAVCLPVTFCLVDLPNATVDQAASQLNVGGSQTSNSASVDTQASSTSHVDSSTPQRLDSSESVAESNSTSEARAIPVVAHDSRVAPMRFLPSFATRLTADTFHSLTRWVTALYLSGVALILGRLLRGVWGGRRLRKMANVINDAALLEIVSDLAHRLGLKVAPTIAWCEQISIPVVVGIVKPMILLPMAIVSGLTPSQLQALLLHEMAHIRRFDPIVNLCQRMIEAVLFFHPIVWFVSRRISVEREHAADDIVLAAGWDRPIYADALVRVAELATAIPCPSAARRATVLGASGSSPTEFKLRVLRLLGDSHPPQLELSRLGIFVTILFVAMGGIFAWSQTKKSATKSDHSHPVAAKEAGAKEPEPFQGKTVAKELELFQGIWAVGQCESEAATLRIVYPEQRWRWTIEGNEIIWGREGQQWRLSAKIDPSTTPKQMDLTFLDGPYKGETSLGIYEWTGTEEKKLRIRMQDPRAKVGRPSGFEMKAGSQTSLIALHSLAPIDPVKELASFQGTWCFDILQIAGWPQPIGIGTDGNGRKSEKRMVVKGNQISWTDRQGDQVTAEFTIDPFKTPKQIDFIFIEGAQRGQKAIGIYEPAMGNDEYRWLCMTHPGSDAPRPTDVSASSLKQQSMIGMYQVAPPEKPSNTKTLERFQGVWKMTLCDSALRTYGATQEEASKWQWTIQGDEVLWNRQVEVWKLKLDVDPSKRPREMDLTYLSGPFQGEKCLGMYEFGGMDEQSLLIAIQDPGAKVPRPKAIEMSGSGKTGLIFLRPSQPSDSERQIGAFQGTWTLRNFDTGKNNDNRSWPLPKGKRPDKSGEGSELRWIIKGNEISWTSSDGQEIKASFTTNPKTRPKQIDLTFLSGPDEGQTCSGIYHRGDFDENILWLCMSDPGSNAARPKSFSYQFGEGRSVLSLYPFEPSTAAPAGASLKP